MQFIIGEILTQNQICMPLYSFQGQQCQKFNIGLNDRSKISDDQFTASTFLSPETAPFHARIGDTEGEGWCAQESRNNEYLQVDLRRDYVVCGVIVQGGIHGNVDSFDLEFSTDGSFFSPYSKVRNTYFSLWASSRSSFFNSYWQRKFFTVFFTQHYADLTHW